MFRHKIPSGPAQSSATKLTCRPHGARIGRSTTARMIDTSLVRPRLASGRVVLERSTGPENFVAMRHSYGAIRLLCSSHSPRCRINRRSPSLARTLVPRT